MKRFLFTATVSLALLSTVQAQTVATPAKATLASEQTPFPVSTKPVGSAVATGTSTHTTLASDSPTPFTEAGSRPATAPAGQAAGSPAPASPPSLADLPSNQGLH